MKLAYKRAASAPLVPGRRSFMEYRDLGVTEATGGWMRAQVGAVKKGMTEPTGWHYHVCEGQFVYALKGSVDLEFEDGTVLNCRAGDSVFIPGGMRHNEMRTSDDFEYLEISLPADMGTVACDPPAAKG
jgi:quercetin dioxygenase-like cupin family protein